MQLTVNSRLIGGAVLFVLLLILFVLTSFRSIHLIEKDLVRLSEKTTPMLIAGSENLSSLLKSMVEVNRYYQATEIAELPVFENNYQKWMKNNDMSNQQLLEFSQNFPDILNSLNQGLASEKKFAESAKLVFQTHREDLQLAEQIQSQKKILETVADELDSLLFDFGESTESTQLNTLLLSISNQVKEISVNIVDTLLVRESTKVSSVKQTISMMQKELMTKSQALAAMNEELVNEYRKPVLKAIEQLNPIINGQQSLLVLHQKRLRVKGESQVQVKQLDDEAEQAKAHMNNLFIKVKNMTQEVTDDAVKQVNTTRNLLMLFTVLAIVIAIGVNLWILKSVTNPINDVLAVVGKVSQGDLTQHARVFHQDELGKLSDGVNQLVTALSSTLKQIENSALQLTASAEQTTVISKQSHENIHYQKEQTDMIATAMTQMNATVSDVANSANHTLIEVQKANQQAAEGRAIVEQSIDSINRLAQEIENAASVIQRLNQYSTNIGSVLDVIRGIAEQTNLLALNAAIEAARAGEQGRGFAVVADEVRELASKTQASTSEIQEMIERLQVGTQEAVKVMQLSQTEAQLSVEKTARAGDSIAKITSAVSVINDMSTHIASAAEEQNSVSQEMHQNISAISEMADKTAQGAAENLTASSALAELADALQKLVSRFKLI
ncbi:methyl-accepting chemotaxis protein [Aliikangiella maris]|uniref:Methyl-accepting chemotaxis protein n=2 Tax=Aliikangiella maris TaxID=3162458 RepID=A0ABV2BT61_9GAMM